MRLNLSRGRHEHAICERHSAQVKRRSKGVKMSTDLTQVGAELTLTVEAAALSGKTLSRLPDGRVVWLDGALCIGDEGVFRITKLRKKSAEATLVSLTQPDARRVEPFCPHVERCGGCPWQAIPSATQVETLSVDLDRSLSRASGVERGTLNWSAPFVSEERAWRHTARLHLEGRAGALRLGFIGREGVFQLDHCPTFAPTLNVALRTLNERLLPKLSALDVTLKGELRLSASRDAQTGTASLSLKSPLSASQAHAIEGALQGCLESGEGLHGLHLSYRLEEARARPARHPKAREKRRERAPLHTQAKNALIHKRWGTPSNQLTTPHPAQAFMQAHQEGNEALVAEVIRRTSGARSILELYSGSGNLSVALAEQDPARELICVEGDEEATRSLKLLAQERGLRHLKARRLNLHTPPEELLERFLKGELVHLILDPPRAGARELIDRLATLANERPELIPLGHRAEITYISCHPAALARDVESLVEVGWSLRNPKLFHLFPHTGHAEVCVTLSRESKP